MMQVRLLRAIQGAREGQRVGGDQTISVNIRLIAATHRNLPQRWNAERYRRSLLSPECGGD
ncbi:sigma 54-interacting transcriptional regulator [Escherichia coli]